MRRRLVVAVGLAVLASSVAAEDKGLARALDDLEKELRGKKEEPAPALELLAHLTGRVGLPAKDALALVRELLARKTPPMVALAASLEREHEATGKTLDLKKWTAAYRKWASGWTSPISGETFYVSPDGQDGAKGSLEAPWKTLQHAIQAAPAGSILVLREGTYPEVIYCEKPLAFRAYPKEKPHLVAPGTAGDAVFFHAKAAGSQLVGLEIEGGKEDAVMINSAGSNRGGWTSCTDVLIERCKIHGCGTNAIKLCPGCDRCIVTRCELHDAKSVGFCANNASFVILQDCHIHDVDAVGAWVKGGVLRAIIERNLVENVGQGIDLGQGTGFPFFTLAREPGNALYESLDCVARNNVVVHTKTAGIVSMGSLRPRIENNTILEAALEGQGGIFLCGAGHDDAEDPYPRELQKTKDASVVNNVVQVGSTKPVVFMTKDTETPRFGNNCYFATKGAAAFWDEALEKPLYGTLDQWRGALGDPGSVLEDPALGADHAPGASSPCLHAGQPLAGFVDDFAAHRRKAWDVGALAEPAKK